MVFCCWYVMLLISYTSQGMEEVEKNIMTMRTMLSGDAEVEPSADQITQLALEICNEDAISLLFHKLPILGWEVSHYVPFNKVMLKCTQI